MKWLSYSAAASFSERMVNCNGVRLVFVPACRPVMCTGYLPVRNDRRVGEHHIYEWCRPKVTPPRINFSAFGVKAEALEYKLCERRSSYPRSSIKRVTKLGLWAIGIEDGAGGKGRLTGLQFVLFCNIPDVTLGTGPCSCGVAVRRHVSRMGLKVKAAHVSVPVHALQHSVTFAAGTCFKSVAEITRPLLWINEYDPHAGGPATSAIAQVKRITMFNTRNSITTNSKIH